MVIEILGYAEEVRATQYATVASLGLITFDWLITIGDEIEFVWYSRWNSTKILFFYTRYMGFVISAPALIYVFGSSLDIHQCVKIAGMHIYSAMVGIVIAEVIMTLRVIALWERSRRIAYLLGTLLLVGVIIAVTIAVVSTTNNPTYDAFVPSLPSCTTLYQTRDGKGYMNFVLLIFFECVIMVLTFWKGITHWRYNVHTNGLIGVFYRDGALYFLFLFALSSANFVIWFRERSNNGYYFYLFFELQRVFHSVITARIVLNLRETATHRQIQVSFTSIHLPCEDASRTGILSQPLSHGNEAGTSQYHMRITTHRS